MKRGFTLVELMVVIVIIGVLGAVAMPRFLSASHKARCSELPTAVAVISQAQFIYHGEENRYAKCDWLDVNGDYANDNFAAFFGLILSGEYFKYTTDTGSDSYTIYAELYRSIGKAAVGTKVSVSDLRVFSYTDVDGDDVASLKSYCHFLQ